MSSSILVRDATDTDVVAIANIYSPYVSGSLATFEEEPPSFDELWRRWQEIANAGLPYLVAESERQIVGYAYASRYRARPGYRFTVEDSVYVAEQWHGKGVGTALLQAVIERCRAGGWRQLVAVIGDSGNAASIALHRRLGFEDIGTLKAVGFKLGRWVDTVLMQRALGGLTAPESDSRRG